MADSIEKALLALTADQTRTLMIALGLCSSGNEVAALAEMLWLVSDGAEGMCYGRIGDAAQLAEANDMIPESLLAVKA